MAEDDLKPLEIDDGISLFLGHKEREVTTQTIAGYETSLDRFKEYCDREGISDLNDLTGRNLEQYRIWRREA